MPKLHIKASTIRRWLGVWRLSRQLALYENLVFQERTTHMVIMSLVSFGPHLGPWALLALGLFLALAAGVFVATWLWEMVISIPKAMSGDTKLERSTHIGMWVILALVVVGIVSTVLLW